MKQLLLILVFFCCAHFANAQVEKPPVTLYDKGMNTVGLAFSGGFGGNFGFVGNTYIRYGKFWANRLNAGVDAGFQVNGDRYRSYLAGPYARYYLLPGKFNPLIETSYQGGYFRNSIGEDTEGFINRFGAGGGISYNGIFDRFGIEVVTLYTITSFRGNDDKDLSTTLRLKYFFGKLRHK